MKSSIGTGEATDKDAWKNAAHALNPEVQIMKFEKALAFIHFTQSKIYQTLRVHDF